MTVRAVIIHSEAWMGKEYGERIARELFGAAIVEALPRNSKGKHVGKLKTTLTFRKVQSGGWVSGGAEGVGHVERRVGKIISAAIVLRAWGGEETTLHTWTYEAAQSARAPATSMSGESRIHRECLYEGE